MRSATSFALERYADERLLSGLAPGAEVAKGGRDASSGLLEVRFEDLRMRCERRSIVLA